MNAKNIDANQQHWRTKLLKVVEGSVAERFIVAVIILNAITLGMETSRHIMQAYGPMVHLLDTIALTIFVIEIGARIVGRGLAFFRDPWGMFDLVVVAIALVPAGGQFSVLRSLRVLRVLRLMSMVPQMRKVVSALLSAIPGLLSIMLVLLLVYYVFAVMATNLFGDRYAEWFGSIGASMYTLFQVMTLESWSMGIVRPVMEQYPYAWMFFIPFILVATFTMLNLFIAIIVNAMQSQAINETEKTVAAMEEQTQNIDQHLSAKLDAMQAELAELKKLLQSRQR